ncbi:histidine--tRNA ligase [Dactylosporangium cerinum]
MTRPTPLSGFPEWLPEQRLAEQQVLDRLRRTFELYGFSPLETRAVEPSTSCCARGDLQGGLHAAPPAGDRRRRRRAEPRPALRPDCPFRPLCTGARRQAAVPVPPVPDPEGVAGERPAAGRYREFLQADIDIVDRDTLPSHYEAEIPLVIGDALRALPIPPVTILVNNRKLCEGFYRGLGIDDPEEILRIVDKLDKVGPSVVKDEIAQKHGAARADACLALAGISAKDASFVDEVRKLGVEHPLLDEGIAELAAVVETAREHSPGLVQATLKIARGLDYYTGTVYETELAGFEQFGSICSGGRYDNLASAGKDVFPGVGISIGVSRLLGLLFKADALSVSRPVPTAVLVALWSEEERAVSNRIAASLRARGIATEVAPVPAKLGKQIRHAERRGIPFVWFPANGENPDQVKDIRSGEQVDAEGWAPPAEDIAPTLR